jgi:ribosomal protein S18 acetylase RimI-like enzyme
MSFAPITLDQNVLELYATLFPELISSITPDYDLINGCFGQQAIWYGLRQDDTVIAFCTIGVMDGDVFLYNVGVNPLYQGQGFGSLLINSIIEKYGHSDIYLFVKKNNRVAINLYRKFNFEYMDHAYVPPDGEFCFMRQHDEIEV